MEDAAPGHVPVACTLGVDEAPGRLQRWQALHRIATPTIRRSSGLLELDYPNTPEIVAEVSDLVDAERRCCGFVTWTVVPGQDRLAVLIRAHPESPSDTDAIAAMFEAAG